jgi:phage pi2 protein 07
MEKITIDKDELKELINEAFDARFQQELNKVDEIRHYPESGYLRLEGEIKAMKVEIKSLSDKD